VTGFEIALGSIVVLLALIYLGIHIGIGLIAVSFAGIWLLRSPELAARMTSAAVNDAIQDYLFGVIPLFVLMGMLVSISNVGRDTFDAAQWLLGKVRGGLGVATVAANAVFAAITGVSIASAAVFTKVATPQMIRHGYSKRFSVGVVAGSSILGMLIPPSLLFILYGVISEQSIGKMFVAGVIPGIIMALGFTALILWMAYRAPHLIGDMKSTVPMHEETGLSVARKGVPIVGLVAVVLGGLYSGILTPTEAGAAGAAGALAIALARRSLTAKGFWRVLVETGHVSVSVLFLVMAASLYSRMLALTGMPAGIADLMTSSGLGPYGFLLIYILIIILLGCLIDSASIMVIVLPIVLPIAAAFQMDLIWFGVITVVAVEIGLLTPPFGIAVYAVKATLDDKSISLKDVFAGAFPFVLTMLAVLVILIAFPILSTALVR
jgi:tripartite ATP-independent transporter DctM subunit